MLIEDTPIQDSALPLEAFKAHLRMGSGFGTEDLQDPVLLSFLRAAVAAIEVRTGKALLSRAFRWTLHAWRDPSAQALPVAPVGAVSQVVQVARNGVRTTVAAQAYWLEQDSQRPRLRATGAVLPSVPMDGAVEISFTAGLGADWDAVPADLRQAVMMLAAHYYEYRNDTGLSDGCMPFGVSSLIERYRTMRMGMRAGL